jgi:hypothetical protein
VNHHNVGYLEANRGVRATKMYLTTTDPSTTYNANVSAETQVFSGDIPLNDYANLGASWKVLASTTRRTGRFFVCDFATNWGATDCMCVRRIQLGT